MPVTRRLILIGTGGSAYDVLDIVNAINSQSALWEIAGFLDDSRPVGSKHLGFPVLGVLRDAQRFSGCSFINVIGSDASYRRRLEIVQSTTLESHRFTSLVHPQASVSHWARLGQGVYVAFGASIGGGVVVGNHVSFSPASVIGHDAVVADGALVAPGAVISGFVKVGRCSYIGAGATIRQRLAIGAEALVGMGAVVTKDVPQGATVVGNPARELLRPFKSG